ncbi:MAG: addiction module protein [Pseudomonadota bacterium]|nr:addiction module protein [Pseudomonadota bacterium]
MTTASRQLLRKALVLTPMERTELTAELFHGFDHDPDTRLTDAWKNEVESRLDAYEAGQLEADSAEAVFARINRR